MEVGENNETVPKQTVPLTPEELGKLNFVERQRLRTRSQKQLSTLFKDAETKKTLKKEALEGARVIRQFEGRATSLELLEKKAKVVQNLRMALLFLRSPGVPKNLLTVAQYPTENHNSLYIQAYEWRREHGYEVDITWKENRNRYLRSGIVFSAKGVDGPVIFFDNLDKEINVPQIKRMGYVVLNEEFEMQ
ncbi:MAG: hypothetical protein MUP45_04880 [Candidatus Marinimicrobia bacterium]|nr:hypothetical protein [Candidatus Neomarinimicrobiota bacterium]